MESDHKVHFQTEIEYDMLMNCTTVQFITISTQLTCVSRIVPYRKRQEQELSGKKIDSFW